MALSVITCAFFAVVMNVNYSRTQKERVKAMNLQQLEGISDELDLIEEEIEEIEDYLDEDDECCCCADDDDDEDDEIIYEVNQSAV